MNKKGLDEMQLQRKNKIGNQTFLLLFYLLLIDMGLYGFGFRWVDYPNNIMIILMLCSGFYTVRLIMGNAFVGPYAKKDKPILKAILTVLVAIFIATAIIILLKNADFNSESQIDELSAPILFITSAVAIIITVLIGFIKKVQNKEDKE